MFKRILWSFLPSILIALAVAACAGGGTSGGSTSIAGADNVPSDVAAAAAEGTPNTTTLPEVDVANAYKLGPGDQVRITVFGNEDLSGEFTIDGQGNLALPLVGAINAGGSSPRELENTIRTSLADGYVVNPQVAIEVLTYRPFYILGEVNNPGSYPYVNGMTVIQAAAVAGGFTYRAAESSITLTRGGTNGSTAVVEPETSVIPGDIIRVPERFF
ncbi:polysaccharide biosynthesis/export family protein [Marinivivus vitaminiproducens]|uniref:polysaccharide biosynthesis/export family protein n=1 Tax=Marinivivus vitaminiproducens TaxID=3035935 RepID=UPI0027A18E2F|nr:polysaccharide export protein [Geminicoccaceae bacterium SCSIO 64248]